MSGIHIFGQELSKSPCQQVYSTNLDLNKSAAYFFQKKRYAVSSFICTYIKH